MLKMVLRYPPLIPSSFFFFGILVIHWSTPLHWQASASKQPLITFEAYVAYYFFFFFLPSDLFVQHISVDLHSVSINVTLADIIKAVVLLVTNKCRINAEW